MHERKYSIKSTKVSSSSKVLYRSSNFSPVQGVKDDCTYLVPTGSKNILKDINAGPRGIWGKTLAYSQHIQFQHLWKSCTSALVCTAALNVSNIVCLSSKRLLHHGHCFTEKPSVSLIRTQQSIQLHHEMSLLWYQKQFKVVPPDDCRKGLALHTQFMEEKKDRFDIVMVAADNGGKGDFDVWFARAICLGCVYKEDDWQPCHQPIRLSCPQCSYDRGQKLYSIQHFEIMKEWEVVLDENW